MLLPFLEWINFFFPHSYAYSVPYSLCVGDRRVACLVVVVHLQSGFVEGGDEHKQIFDSQSTVVYPGVEGKWQCQVQE